MCLRSLVNASFLIVVELAIVFELFSLMFPDDVPCI